MDVTSGLVCLRPRSSTLSAAPLTSSRIWTQLLHGGIPRHRLSLVRNKKIRKEKSVTESPAEGTVGLIYSMCVVVYVWLALHSLASHEISITSSLWLQPIRLSQCTPHSAHALITHPVIDWSDAPSQPSTGKSGLLHAPSSV